MSLFAMPYKGKDALVNLLRLWAQGSKRKYSRYHNAYLTKNTWELSLYVFFHVRIVFIITAAHCVDLKKKKVMHVVSLKISYPPWFKENFYLMVHNCSKGWHWVVMVVNFFRCYLYVIYWSTETLSFFSKFKNESSNSIQTAIKSIITK